MSSPTQSFFPSFTTHTLPVNK
uniref:Uncharacterized protein n=1 Tax=Anguilla anguilla TaxID=7936 RepID=A0A0E9PKB7_ANGAN